MLKAFKGAGFRYISPMKNHELDEYTDRKTLHAICYLLLVAFFFAAPFYYGAQGVNFTPALIVAFSCLAAAFSLGLLVTMCQILRANISK